MKPFVIILMVFFSGCSAEMSQNFTVKPPALGKSNQIFVICDQDLWDGYVGDSLRYYYESPYPILPQPEAYFDIKHFAPEDLTAKPLRKELRSYLIVADLNDKESPTSQLIAEDLGPEKIRNAKDGNKLRSTVGRDKWAQGQLLIYLFDFEKDALCQTIKKSFPAAAKRFTEFDEKQIESTVYIRGENRNLKEEIKAKMGVDIRVPGDYVKAIENDEIIWIRKDTPELISNIMLTKIPYESKAQLTKDGLKSLRDTLGRKYISTSEEGSYMRTNDVDLPLYTKAISVNNFYTLEARGIWDIENDFMGGPFLSYIIHNPNTNELLYMDGFVYAPGKQKRNYMQHLEHIFASVKF